MQEEKCTDRANSLNGRLRSLASRRELPTVSGELPSPLDLSRAKVMADRPVVGDLVEHPHGAVRVHICDQSTVLVRELRSGGVDHDQSGVIVLHTRPKARRSALSRRGPGRGPGPRAAQAAQAAAPGSQPSQAWRQTAWWAAMKGWTWAATGLLARSW